MASIYFARLNINCPCRLRYKSSFRILNPHTLFPNKNQPRIHIYIFVYRIQISSARILFKLFMLTLGPIFQRRVTRFINIHIYMLFRIVYLHFYDAFNCNFLIAATTNRRNYTRKVASCGIRNSAGDTLFIISLLHVFSTFTTAIRLRALFAQCTETKYFALRHGDWSGQKFCSRYRNSR